MKKTISILACLTVAVSVIAIPIYAQAEDEIIIKADGSSFTCPEETNIGQIGDDWAKDGEAIYAVDNYNFQLNTPDNTYITYEGMPKGEYDVYYYVAGSDNSDGRYRSSRALDSDITVTDAYGIHLIESVRPYIGYIGYVKVGTYYFNGDTDVIKVTANTYDNRNTDWLGPRMLITHSIKLVPTADHSVLLEAVNKAENVQAIKAAIENFGESYVDRDFLEYMKAVYKEILEKRPTGGYKIAHEIKRTAENVAERKQTTYKADSCGFIWAPRSEPNVYRNYVNVASLEYGGSAVIMFKDLPKGKIKKVELKFDIIDGGRSTNAVASKVCNKIYDNFVPGQTREDVNSVLSYVNMEESKYVSSGFKDITDNVLKNAINENGELSLYMTLDDMGDAAQIRTLLIKPEATLKITYDDTVLDERLDVAKTVAAANTLDEAVKILQDNAGLFEITDVEASQWAIALFGESIVTLNDIDSIISQSREAVVYFSCANIDYLDGVINGQIYLKNMSGDDIEPTVAAAAYRDGKMVSVTYLNKAAVDNCIYICNLGFSAPDVDTLKVFAFENMNSVKPIAEFYETNLLDEFKRTLLLSKNQDGKIMVKNITGINKIYSLFVGSGDKSNFSEFDFVYMLDKDAVIEGYGIHQYEFDADKKDFAVFMVDNMISLRPQDIALD